MVKLSNEGERIYYTWEQNWSLVIMGHDNHAGMSPAHRRNQNPLSPSATLFRRSSTFSREELDQSWMALFRRHRFLLLTLALLAFLCTVYLYFAIKLGADSCSGLSANEEARCLLKKSNVKTSRGQRATRVLLSVQESMLEPWSQNHAEVVKVSSYITLFSSHKAKESPDGHSIYFMISIFINTWEMIFCFVSCSTHLSGKKRCCLDGFSDQREVGSECAQFRLLRKRLDSSPPESGFSLITSYRL